MIILKILRRLSVLVLYFLSFFIPVKKKLVVFSMSRGRYSDNSRYLFEFLASDASKNIKAIWLADELLDISAIPEQFRILVISRNSVMGWLSCCRAEFAIISHGFGDFGPLRKIAKRKKVICLWHAVMIKNSGLLDAKFSKKQKIKYLKNETSHYDILIASSVIDAYYSVCYTGIKFDKVRITGLPRNDRLFAAIVPPRECRRYFSILYAPTFRDYTYKLDFKSLFFPFHVYDNHVYEWARANKFVFFLRPHPNDADSVNHLEELVEKYPDCFVDARDGGGKDSMDWILSSDAIVTDYSSIYVDALAINKPVMFVDFDRDLYLKTRGLAYDYDLVAPGPKVSDYEGFKTACEQMSQGASEWESHREFFRKMFFSFRDSKSCERVRSVIDELS